MFLLWDSLLEVRRVSTVIMIWYDISMVEQYPMKPMLLEVLLRLYVTMFLFQFQWHTPLDDVNQKTQWPITMLAVLFQAWLGPRATLSRRSGIFLSWDRLIKGVCAHQETSRLESIPSQKRKRKRVCESMNSFDMHALSFFSQGLSRGLFILIYFLICTAKCVETVSHTLYLLYY